MFFKVYGGILSHHVSLHPVSGCLKFAIAYPNMEFNNVICCCYCCIIIIFFLLQVPCSPPPIEEEMEKGTEENVEKKHKDGDSVSGESSSSGR